MDLLNGTALYDLLMFLIFGGGAGAATYKLLNWPRLSQWLVKVASWFGVSVSEVRRYASIAISVSISVALWYIAAQFGYLPMPVTVKDWLNLIIGLAGLAYPSSQVIHGRLVLRRRG